MTGGGASALIPIGALWLALAIDAAFGEPSARWHPVVWMGRYLGWAGSRVAPRAGESTSPDVPRLAAGAAAWWAGAAVVLLAAWVLVRAVAHLPAWAAAPLTGLALKPLLAWRMLRDEVSAVEAALGFSSDAGRAQLARLVSRDVRRLGDGEIRESAIESLAENLNDSLVAPVFWFVLFGLPGAALYRFANTADAMWGYRGVRGGRDWEWAGKWAARADDVLSWLPARLTALLLWATGALLRARTQGTPKVALPVLRREARLTPSPNSGWPMAAMALLLGVRLAKPGVYILNAAGREPSAQDIDESIAAGSRVALVLAFGAAAAIAALAGFGWP